MDSKLLMNMSKTELMRECAYRGLSYNGTRNDLLVMLEGHIRDVGSDPNSTLLPPRPPIDDLTLDESSVADANRGGTNNSENANANITIHREPAVINGVVSNMLFDSNTEELQPPQNNRSMLSSQPPPLNPISEMFDDLRVVNTIQTASTQIGDINRDIRLQALLTRMEIRISELEMSVLRYRHEEVRNEERFRRIKSCLRAANINIDDDIDDPLITHPRSSNIRLDQDAPIGPRGYTERESNRLPDGLVDRLSSLEIANERFTPSAQQPNRDRRRENVRFQCDPPPNQTFARDHFNESFQSNRLHPGGDYDYDRRNYAESTIFPRSGPTSKINSSDHYYNAGVGNHERSILIPLNDLTAARASFPEFSGAKEEDPVEFLDSTECILRQSKIHRSSWVRAVEPQLKGAAESWWKPMRVLKLSWTEFRGELAERFDNSDLQAHLLAEILSVRQGTNQRLTDFVLHKNQLTCRVRSPMSEAQIVSTIIGLMRDEFRTHLRLQQPTNFVDLRRIAHVLDSTTYATDNSSAVPHNTPQVHASRYQPRPNINPPNNGENAQNARRPNTDRTRNRDPPSPCLTCGGNHWHRFCPNNSGNGGGAQGH